MSEWGTSEWREQVSGGMSAGMSGQSSGMERGKKVIDRQYTAFSSCYKAEMSKSA